MVISLVKVRLLLLVLHGPHEAVPFSDGAPADELPLYPPEVLPGIGAVFVQHPGFEQVFPPCIHVGGFGAGGIVRVVGRGAAVFNDEVVQGVHAPALLVGQSGGAPACGLGLHDNTTGNLVAVGVGAHLNHL